MSRPPLELWRTRLAALTAVLIVAAIIYALTIPSDRQVVPPTMVGSLWSVGDSANPLLAYITKEERARSSSDESEGSSVLTRAYTRYELVVRVMPDANVTHVRRMVDVHGEGGDAHLPNVIGATADILWVWRDSLEAYHLPELSLLVTQNRLTRPADVGIDIFPVDATNYSIAPNMPATLVFKGRDANFYRVDQIRGSTPSLSPLDLQTLPPAPDGSTQLERRFDALIAPGRTRTITHPYSVMQKHFITVTGRWYALLSEGERSGLLKWPSGEDHPSGDVARSLYGAPYQLDDRKVPQIDLGNVKPLGSERLIQGGFLVREPRAVWDVAEPSSSLVLAKAQLGDEEPWDVVRLARDGRIVWRTSTGLSKPDAILDLRSHILFRGTPPGNPASHDELIVWIDLRTGARHELSPATGLVR